jgi:hypothetical protein
VKDDGRVRRHVALGGRAAPLPQPDALTGRAYDIVEDGTPIRTGWGRVCLLQMLAVDACEQHRALLINSSANVDWCALTTGCASR